MLEALLKLPNPFPQSKHIQPAMFPTDCGELSNYTQVIAAGTGRTEFLRDTNDTRLYQISLQALNDTQCAISTFFRLDYGSMICAYSTDGQTVYFGDSGESHGIFMEPAWFVYQAKAEGGGEGGEKW